MSGDLQEGLESSEGDPKVLLLLNAVLSVAFAYTVLWLSDLAGLATFTWPRLAAFALGLMVLTYVVTMN